MTVGATLIVDVCMFEGNQVNVFAPLTVSVTVLPTHMAELLELTTRAGKLNVAMARFEMPYAPQVDVAATLIEPGLLIVALMVLVADAPTHPPGKVQV